MTSPALKEIVERMRAAAEHTRAHATHWRQPYQRFCLEIARTENEWADEIERAASLTAEQREALEAAIAGLEMSAWPGPKRNRCAAVLRALLGESEGEGPHDKEEA